MLDVPPPATGRTDTGLGLRYRLLLPLARAVVFVPRQGWLWLGNVGRSTAKQAKREPR